MTKKKLNKLIAKLILAANEAGIPMESPYDITNLFEDHLSRHQNSMDFFYDKEGEPIDAIKKAKEVINKS